MNNPAPLKILVIDDEPQITKFLRIALQSEGYQPLLAHNGAEGLRLAALQQPALVVLDLGLPDQDGIDVLRQLREWSQVPVLVLSVRAQETDKVRALDAGAHDYVTKPFGIQEFMARLRVLLRNQGAIQTTEQPQEFCAGPLRINFPQRRVYLDGAEVHLSRKEYALLTLLARHADQVVTQPFILEQIWGPSHREDTHYLRIFIARLRQKLGDDPTQPRLIQTEQGVGYRLLTERHNSPT